MNNLINDAKLVGPKKILSAQNWINLLVNKFFYIFILQDVKTTKIKRQMVLIKIEAIKELMRVSG